jgi:DNA excision repair protein ERCC-4
VEKRAPIIHSFKRTETLSEAQMFFVASLPKIGRENASALLKAYRTPLNALVNVDDWPKTVYGLGPVITKKVKEIIGTPYEE